MLLILLTLISIICLCFFLFRFTDIQGLGVSLLQKNSDSSEIRDCLVQLQEEQDAIHRGWQEKGDWLRQCMDLQVFNREADQIDSITNSHNAFLEFEDLGVSIIRIFSIANSR